MSSETSVVAEQCRLREWAAQIQDCQSRPAGMSIVSWCACHGITKANYYYRLRRVRKACLEAVQAEMPAQQMVPVQPELLQHQEQIGRNLRPGLDISIKGFSIHVAESTSMSLLVSWYNKVVTPNGKYMIYSNQCKGRCYTCQKQKSMNQNLKRKSYSSI